MSLFPSTMRGKLSALGLGTYSLSTVALGWAYGTEIGQSDWRILLWAGALPAIMIAPLVFLFLPDDRNMKPWGAETLAPPAAKLPMVELFAPGLRRSTLLLFILVGLNFFAYQAFGGWVTTYLKDVKLYEPESISRIVTWQAIGGLLGCFFWGWFSDRYGRRLTGLGFFAAGAAVVLYVTILDSPFALLLGGALWGFMISAAVAWAPWMSELYPPHLRSTAMSIFHWGRIISMTAPLVTGAVAESFGLPVAMTMSAVALVVGGFVWLMIPETNERRRAPASPPLTPNM
jgi:MFS family permease